MVSQISIIPVNIVLIGHGFWPIRRVFVERPLHLAGEIESVWLRPTEQISEKLQAVPRPAFAPDALALPDGAASIERPRLTHVPAWKRAFVVDAQG